MHCTRCGCPRQGAQVCNQCGLEFSSIDCTVNRSAIPYNLPPTPERGPIQYHPVAYQQAPVPYPSSVPLPGQVAPVWASNQIPTADVLAAAKPKWPVILLGDFAVCAVVGVAFFAINVLVNYLIGWPKVSVAGEVHPRVVISNVVQWSAISVFSLVYLLLATLRRKSLSWRLFGG